MRSPYLTIQRCLRLCLSIGLIAAVGWSASVRYAGAEPPAGPAAMSLVEAVDNAIEANLELKQSRQEISAAEANRSVERSNLLPIFSTDYRYTRNDDDFGGAFAGGFSGTLRDEYSLSATVRQPLFEGFSLINRYEIADIGIDVAGLNQRITRLEVIFLTKRAYFNVLKNQKLVLVALDSVKLLEAQVDVARNFYEVGMTPLNDLLQVQVELANAKQDLTVAQNNLDIAESEFNIILRRPVNAPVNLIDITEYQPLIRELDHFLSLAEENRFDLLVADLQIQVAEKEVTVARSGYYPSVNLEATWFRRGANWDLSDQEEFRDPDGWSVAGVASWNFWEWGRTAYNEKEKTHRLAQVRLEKQRTLDTARLEVERAFLNAKQSEKNIVTVEAAIEQARENWRITQERFKEQVATSTDLLVAQNLLVRTQNNYFNALYDFKIAKAALQRAINLEMRE